MDSIVEENGNSSNVDEGGHNLSTGHQTHQAGSGGPQPPSATAPPTASAASVLTATPNVHYISQPGHGLQSVIQANQSSVIQTAATNAHPVSITKGNLVYVPPKPNTVIHTTPGNAIQFPPQFPCKIKHEPNSHQILDTNSEDSLSEEDSPRGVKEIKRRPSYNKIFNDISGPDISAGGHLQMTESGGLPTIACTGGGATGTVLHLQQDSSAQPFYISNRIQYNTNNTGVAEDQTRKREIRLQKNREAARECRRKKKEYIKCLENRVAVLENQNKALIEELKSLKELYCQTKND